MKYRYCLERTWDSGAASLAFILLNPSTADEIVNDPTIERCERRARQACFGGIVVCNLFAWRATDPAALRKVEDPIGPDNDLILDRLLGPKKKTPDNIICGWGAHGAYRGRNQQMINLFEKHRITPMALKITKNGHPQHPLYLAYDAKPQPFIGIAA